MKLLHLSTDFPYQNVYNEIVSELDSRGFEQEIFIPLRRPEDVDKNKNNDLQGANYHYAPLLKPWMKLFYHRKIAACEKEVARRVDVANIDLIHAHFLFSDGGVAYRLQRIFKTDYVVTVRNADINYYWKLMPHLRSYATKVLQAARSVIFLSPAFQRKLLNEYLSPEIAKEIEAKSTVVTNPLPSFWLENKASEPRQITPEQKIRILYVGEYSKNKNLETLIKAVKQCRMRHLKLQLDLVGEYGADTDRILELVKDHPKFARSHSKVTDPKELVEFYRSADLFCMPSHRESFGVVYLEALSQGLPIVYTQNQGIDGLFDQSPVGAAVDPKSINSVSNGIQNCLDRYSEYSLNAVHQIERFNRTRVGDALEEVYGLRRAPLAQES